MPWDPANERRRRDRRQEDPQAIGRDDLYLLLESYRNTVEYSTTVLERQEAINEGLQRILAQVVAICETQGKLLERINGLVDFRADDGRLTDVEPGGAGRVFGLLSVQALPRRLRLDFSDMFREGFGYDRRSSRHPPPRPNR